MLYDRAVLRGFLRILHFWLLLGHSLSQIFQTQQCDHLHSVLHLRTSFSGTDKISRSQRHWKDETEVGFSYHVLIQLNKLTGLADDSQSVYLIPLAGKRKRACPLRWQHVFRMSLLWWLNNGKMPSPASAVVRRLHR